MCARRGARYGGRRAIAPRPATERRNRLGRLGGRPTPPSRRDAPARSRDRVLLNNEGVVNLRTHDAGWDEPSRLKLGVLMCAMLAPRRAAPAESSTRSVRTASGGRLRRPRHAALSLLRLRSSRACNIICTYELARPDGGHAREETAYIRVAGRHGRQNNGVRDLLTKAWRRYSEARGGDDTAVHPTSRGSRPRAEPNSRSDGRPSIRVTYAGRLAKALG